MSKKVEKEYKLGISPFLILLIGIIYGGALIFSYFESNFLNTYLDHVLNLTPMHIALMVSCSALIGLIFLPLWGIKSDNSRTKFGRRRPFLLFGIIAGTGMILYAFSPNFLICFLLDVIIIGIFSNAMYAGQRSLIPDLVEVEYRGRVNGIVSIIASGGLILGIVMWLIANEFFTVKKGVGNILTQKGHIFLLSFGGLAMIFVSILGFLFIREDLNNFPPKHTFFEDLQAMFNLDELKKHREFFKLILAITVYKAGLGIIMPYLFNFIFSLGLETMELILIMSIATPVLFLTCLLLGRITDRYGRKRFIIPITFITCVGFFALPFLAESRPINLILLLGAITLVLVGALGVLIPLDTWSQDLLPVDKRAQFTGILNIINTVSQIIGALVGGIAATLLIGVVINPLAWLFALVPFFLLLSLPLFMRVEESLPKTFREDIL